MNLDACIHERRSVRAYLPKPVPREIIESVLEAGTWAPTGMGSEPWRFVVIEDPAVIRYASEETKRAARQTRQPMTERFATDKDVICYEAPVLILVCAEESEIPILERVRLLDCVLAAQNMFLKAYELGLGTCYMGYIDAFLTQPDILKKLGVPDGYQLMVPFVLGYPKNKQGAGARKKPIILNWFS